MTNNEHTMKVCYRCLMAIESHEGPQFSRKVYFDEDDGQCDWCGDAGFDELNELV